MPTLCTENFDMKVTFIANLSYLILFFYPNQLADKGYSSYCNSKFDFCIQYPSSFKKLPPPENGDGLIFISADSLAEIRAYGSLVAALDNGLSDEYSFATTSLDITYKRMTDHSFIISGMNKDNRIIYRKTSISKIRYMGEPGTQVFRTLMIEYPASQSAQYEEYCRRISNSLN